VEKVLVWINKFKVKTNQYHAAAQGITFGESVCVCVRFRVFDILNAPFHWRIFRVIDILNAPFHWRIYQCLKWQKIVGIG
jgi:hypothetical protein